MRLADADVNVEELLRTLNVEIVKTRDGWLDCLCPLHPEKNPSFSINRDSCRWICRHGDQKGGALDLVIIVKGISSSEAAKYVKGLPTTDPGDEAVFRAIAAIGRDKPVVTDLAEWDARFRSLDPGVMSEYLFERGFDERDMRDFEVRFDAEQERLVWPIRDENANLIGYCARKLPGSTKQRYLYPRGFQRALFPLSFHSGSSVVLCEGPLDAMWLHKHGYNGLAMLGSALTNAQRAWLFARVSDVTIMTDNDETGIATRSKLVKQLSGLNVSLALLPEHRKDVQECTRDEIDDSLATKQPITVAVVNGLISLVK